jgi:nitrogen PTS system EIIA component
MLRLKSERLTMKLADLIAPEQVLTDVSAPNKHSLLQALSRRAGEALNLDPGMIFNAVVERERLGGTGVGRGIAVPRGILCELKTPYVLFTRLSRGLDFESFDDVPVDIVCFILRPPPGDKDTKELLADIVELVRSDEFWTRVRAAPSQVELFGILSGGMPS